MKILLIPVFIGLLALTSNMDYTDEQAAHNQYKSDVCEGIYPDYKKVGVECE